ncbi:hypothetical protein [Paenibacillus mendelii]|uniref:NAD(P)-binding domain-containing protein n=1 Tax=Paenibacillus mendelii TaxID=206163 RepID=A0ABV6JKB6_9BACL|nr:hypothetical protein [Paenibacillus mendelii]
MEIERFYCLLQRGAVILAIEAKNMNGQIFNVADDEPVTAAEIMKIYNEPITEDFESRPIDPSWLQLLDTQKIREQLGFKPIYPALRNVVDAGAL